MKGICQVWSRGRHFSPSLPGNSHLNLGSKSDLRAEISESIVELIFIMLKLLNAKLFS